MSIIDTLRAQLAAAYEARAAKAAELDTILAAPEAEARDLNSDESVAFAEARDAVKATDSSIETLEARVAELVALETARTNHETRARELAPNATTVRVGREELTYRADAGHSFLRDAYSAEVRGDFAARQRIERHMVEMATEHRASDTGAFSGLVVPQYLTDQVAPFARAGRPFADAVRQLPLPAEGLSVNISRVTTGSTAASQATENSSVSNTDMDDTLLTVPVRTLSGMQDVSRQAIERGTGVDTVVIQDLVNAYATQLDSQIIGGAGTSGTHTGVLSVSGINSVTLTSSSPTAALLYPKIADAVQRVNSLRYMPANLIVMHPRRWAFLLASVDSSNRPLITPNAGNGLNTMGTGGNTGAGIVGQIMGIDVLVDANVPTNLGAGTNEDRIIVCYSPDLCLWEQTGSPMQLRFEQTLGGQLTIKLVAFGYSAFTAGKYPAGISVISGTGLVTPSF
jgi:HK97 family phage major capsid protein